MESSRGHGHRRGEGLLAPAWRVGSSLTKPPVGFAPGRKSWSYRKRCRVCLPNGIPSHAYGSPPPPPSCSLHLPLQHRHLAARRLILKKKAFNSSIWKLSSKSIKLWTDEFENFQVNFKLSTKKYGTFNSKLCNQNLGLLTWISQLSNQNLQLSTQIPHALRIRV